MRAGCFQLSDITFLKTYPTLAQLLPPDHRPPPPEVNTTNANLGARAKAALRDHPRVVRGRHAHPAMPTEGAFASMRSSGGADVAEGPGCSDACACAPGAASVLAARPSMRGGK